jgi:hypothetical protein
MFLNFLIIQEFPLSQTANVTRFLAMGLTNWSQTSYISIENSSSEDVFSCVGGVDGLTTPANI